VVIARRSRAQHRQGLIDILRLRVAGHNRSRSVGLFHQIVVVVGVDGCTARRRFVDSSAERVVFEGDGSAAAGQRDAAQAVFEVPGIGGGVGAGHAGEGVAVGVVDVDAGAGRRGFVDSSPERMVFEALAVAHLPAAHGRNASLFGRDYPVFSLEK